MLDVFAAVGRLQNDKKPPVGADGGGGVRKCFHLLIIAQYPQIVKYIWAVRRIISKLNRVCWGRSL